MMDVYEDVVLKSLREGVKREVDVRIAVGRKGEVKHVDRARRVFTCHFLDFT
jgi:hypothetical protein